MGFVDWAGITRAQDSTRTEQRVARGEQREDAQIDALETGRWALKIAVVDRQHHRPAAGRVENAREAILHAPVELVGAFQIKSRRKLRLLDLVFFPSSSASGMFHPAVVLLFDKSLRCWSK
jgi:hypothetical protein